jgi:hypothetical protein
MKNTILYIVLFIIFSLEVLPFSGNGSGTEADPYQITNVHQLQEMNDDLSAHYILMNDIDASETREWNVGDHDNDPATPDSAMGFEPVGTFEEENPQAGFTGSLDGKGNTISFLYINRPAYDNIAFLGCVSNGAKTHNLHINKATIVGNEYVGIFISVIHQYSSSIENHIEIQSCSTNGSVFGISYVGGFFGASKEGYYVTFTDCYSSPDIFAKGNYIGGFCGFCQRSTGIYYSYSSGNVYSQGNYVGGFCGQLWGVASNCYSSGNVEGGSVVGGFCGDNGEAQSCYSTSDVIGHGNYVGGFCGKNGTYALANCSSSGNVTGYGNHVGGFCGSNPRCGLADLSIFWCFSKGDVFGSGTYVGGFCGSNYCTLYHNYSLGNVEGESDYVGGFCGLNLIYINQCYSEGDVIGNGSYVGGFCGSIDYEVTDCYSTGDVAGKNIVGGFCGSINTEREVNVKRCYSIGSPSGNTIGGFCGLNENPNDGQIISSYWDTQTSEIDTSDGGEGKTTAEMMMQSTFVDWDFDNVWCMVEGKTYPQLQHFVDCDTLVSVEDIKNDVGIEIYPNPATDKITVSSNLLIGKEIQIYNLLGSLVWQGSATDYNFDIDISALPRSLYVLKVNNQAHLFVKN